MLISRIYSWMHSAKSHSTTYVKSKWEKEADKTLTEEDWLTVVIHM